MKGEFQGSEEAGSLGARTGCWVRSTEELDSEAPEAGMGSKHHIWTDGGRELDSRPNVSKSQGKRWNEAAGFQEWCLQSPKATFTGLGQLLWGIWSWARGEEEVVQLVHSFLPLILKPKIKLFLAFPFGSLLFSGQFKTRSKSPQALLLSLPRADTGMVWSGVQSVRSEHCLGSRVSPKGCLGTGCRRVGWGPHSARQFRSEWIHTKKPLELDRLWTLGSHLVPPAHLPPHQTSFK